MNKALFLGVLLLISLHSFGQERVLNSNEIKELKVKVKAKSETTQTIKSDFVQYKHLDFLSNDIKTEGKLAYKSPNLVKWEYTNPYKYSVIFKNNSLLINDDGKKNTINIGSSKLFEKMNVLIVKSIRGDMFDDAEFDISYHKSKSSYIVKFLLKDINFKKVIKQFVLHFDVKTYDVTQVKMIEPSNDYTKIVFKNRKLNIPLNNAIFSN